MVVYYANTSFAVILSTVHKEYYNKYEEAVLILSNWSLVEKINISNCNHYFSSVIFSEFSIAYSKGIKDKTVIECENLILDKFCNILSDIEVESVKSWYITMDIHNDIGVFLSLKNIDYSILELSSSQMTKSRDGIAKNKKNSDNEVQVYYELLDKYLSLSCSSPNCKKMFSFNSVECINDYSKSVEIECFSFPQFYANATQTMIEFFLDIFNVKDCSFSNEESTILFTERQWRFPCSLEETAVRYGLLADYFIKSPNLIIKPHPSDEWNHADVFYQNYIVDKTIPAEILPFYIPKIKDFITIASTSNDHLSGFSIPQVNIGLDFYQNYEKIFKYTVALHLFYMLLPSEKIYRHGVNMNFLNLIEESEFGTSNVGNTWLDFASNIAVSYCLVDIISSQYKTYNMQCGFEDKLHDNSALLFIDINTLSISDTILDFLIPIKLNKRLLADLDTRSPEFVYVFTKNPETRRKILNFSFSKELKYTGIEIYVEPTTEEQVGKQIAELRQKLLFQEIVELKQQVSLLPKELPYSHTEELQDLKELLIQRTPLQFPPPIKMKEENPVVVELLNQIVLSQNEKKEDLSLLHESNNRTQETLANLVVQLEQVSLSMTLLQESQVQTQELESFVLVSKQSLYARLIQKIDQKYPKGSKKREFWKKFAEKFL